MYYRGYTNVLAHNRNLDKYREEVPKSVLESIDRYPDGYRQRRAERDATEVLHAYDGWTKGEGGGEVPLVKAPGASQGPPGAWGVRKYTHTLSHTHLVLPRARLEQGVDQF